MSVMMYLWLLVAVPTAPCDWKNLLLGLYVVFGLSVFLRGTIQVPTTVVFCGLWTFSVPECTFLA